jgi:hypothetical protein
MTIRSYLCGLVVLVTCAAYPTAHAATPSTKPAAGSVSPATRFPGFPAKPADIDPAEWTALQNAVAQNLPASAELTGSDGAAGDDFGYSVALSGTTALVGAENKTIGSNTFQGAAYVFTFNGSTWSQQQELTASDGAAGDQFGFSVALSGTTALVGAYNKTVGSNVVQGAAYVFTFNGSAWIQQQELTASDGSSNDYFGYSVAVSGTTALVGANIKTIGSNFQQGTAYVFTFNGSTWIQQQELTASNGAADDVFGYSVALSGTTALVGAYNKTIGAIAGQGAAYVFTFSGSTWRQQQELTASDGATNDEFGSSVALSGTTALVGAQRKNIGSADSQGAAYVFTFNGTTWSQHQELTASTGAGNDHFGYSVALAGTTALVGAPFKQIGLNGNQGVTYVFTFNGSTWIQESELIASDGAAIDQFGISVALSGTTALVGADGKTIGSHGGQGVAYVYPAVSDTIFCDNFDGTGLCN